VDCFGQKLELPRPILTGSPERAINIFLVWPQRCPTSSKDHAFSRKERP
jgi:hypothetical protein